MGLQSLISIRSLSSVVHNGRRFKKELLDLQTLMEQTGAGFPGVVYS